jgi:hypothetical protein
VAHAVVTVDQRRGRSFFHHLDLRPHVDRAAKNAPDVDRHPDHAVAVGALQVGLGHELADGAGVIGGQTDRLHGGGDEGGKPRVRDVEVRHA